MGRILDYIEGIFGAATDAKSASTDGTSVNFMQVLKEISYKLQNPASTAVTGTFYQTTQPTSDAGPAWTSAHGVSNAPFTSADAHGGLASVTDAPTSGQKLVITDLVISNNSAVTIQFTFKEETSGTPIVTGPISVPAGMATQFTTRGKAWKISAANKKLQVITDVAGAVMVDAHYFSEA
jgi:hypothetical protein